MLALLLRRPDLGRLGLVGGPALSPRDHRDRIGNDVGPIRDRRPEAERLLGPKARRGRGRLPAGICEQARGRNQAADEAWAGSRQVRVLAHEAMLARMRARSTTRAIRRRRASSSTTRPKTRAMTASDLARRCSCRSTASSAASMKRSGSSRSGGKHLNDKGEGASEPAIDLVRMHIELTFKPNPVEDVRAYLDQACSAGPGRRSRLAGSSEPGHPDGRLRRGRAVARCLPEAPAGGCPGLARLAAPGASRPTGRRRASRP